MRARTARKMTVVNRKWALWLGSWEAADTVQQRGRVNVPEKVHRSTKTHGAINVQVTLRPLSIYIPGKSGVRARHTVQ